MKKFLFFASAIADLFLAGSCQREMIDPVVEGGVTYTITLPEAVQTKGNSGYSDYSLHYEVYKTIDAAALPTAPLLFEKSVDFTGNTATVSLDLLNDQDYTVLFWANKKGVTETYFDLTDLRNVQLKTGSLNANDNDRDAFCGMDQIDNHDGSVSKTVKLTRPFAQVNIGTIVPTVAEIGYDVTPQESYVKISGVPVAYNVLQGKAVAGTSNVEFKQSAIPADKKIGTDYTLVAMNYVLVPESNITVEYRIKTPNGDVKNIVSNVPVKKNYRTNIIGNLLTSNASYTVEILPGFETPAEEVELWDGKTLTAPDFDPATSTWTIDNGAELAWLANAVNETLPSTKAGEAETETTPVYKSGDNVVLGADINLGDREWTPIGVGNKRFSGTFDGKGHIISNFKITTHHGGAYQAALFGNLAGTVVIKNLTIEKAEVVYPGKDDFYAAALVATAYGNVTLENVTVKDSYISGNNKVAGILAHDGVVSSLNINNCHVLNCKIESLNEEDGGNVGGLVGLLQAGIEHSIKNSSVKKTVINGINSSNTGKRANAQFVACVYGKDALTVKIENCEVSENTFTQNEGVTYVSPYGVFVGGYREHTGIPTVIVDGKDIYGVAKVGDVRYLTIEDAIGGWTNGKTLTLLADVTLSDVVTLKSTEHHILDLGTYTLTAASGEHAIEITCNGRTNASYALTINADATHPGGISAKGKACIYYKKGDSTKDRPIILINNGVFTGSYSINSISNGNTNCPQIWINGGVFNSYMNLTKNMLRVYGGTFHAAINCTGDQNAYRQISGGRFKNWQFMTADAPNKFAVSSAMSKDSSGNWIGTYDVGVYVDDEGYLVVGGPVITEFDSRFQAKAKHGAWSSYLKYSSAATYGLYYTDASLIKKESDIIELNPNLNN